MPITRKWLNYLWLICTVEYPTTIFLTGKKKKNDAVGEGNGNPLQCSCLENPRDGEHGGLMSMGLHRVGHD